MADIALTHTRGTPLTASDEPTTETDVLLAVRRTRWQAPGTKGIAHDCYTLVGCPPVQKCNVILVKRSSAAPGEIVHVGRLERADTLNLADIRQIGATLGATEVHIHVPKGGATERARLDANLRAAAADGQLKLIGDRD